MIENLQNQYLVWCSLGESYTMHAHNWSVFKEISVFSNENWKVCQRYKDLKSHKTVHKYTPSMTEVWVGQLSQLF